MKKACEEAKKALSAGSQASIDIEAIDFYSTMTRPEFEDLCSSLITRAFEAVVRAIENARLSKSDIDEIVLAGGSSRIPKIQRMLKEYFGGKPLNKSIHPDEAIAYGAAVHAAKLGGDDSTNLNDLALQELLPLSLGLEVGNGKMGVLIPKNTPIPTKSKKTFYTTCDNQTEATFRIFQGERPLTKDNHYIGEVTLNGLNPAPRRKTKVRVTFKVDQNGILTVRVKDPETGKSEKVIITEEHSRLPSNRIEEMLQAAQNNKAEDDRERDRLDALHSLIRFASHLRDVYTSASPEDEEIQSQIKAALHWCDHNPKASIERIKAKHDILIKISQI